MTQKINEPLFMKIGPMLSGRSFGDIVPTLIVLTARVLAQAAESEEELKGLVISFAEALAREAVDMLDDEARRNDGGPIH